MKHVLDPVERVSEIIFGVLMAMTFIGALSVAESGREDVRTTMIAALGCNLAWGLVDAIMYLVAVLTERTREESARGAKARLHGDDFRGALGVFLLVTTSTFPLVVPFFFFGQLASALLASRLVALAMLFASGWLLAGYAGGNRWLAGAAMAAVGALLVGALMALGG